MWISKKKLKEFMKDLEFQVGELQQDIHCLERKVDYMTQWRLVEHVEEGKAKY